MPYDPTVFAGSARHYLSGRPPYSAELAATLSRELGLDGHGRLLDVGCGPGSVALRLAHLFEEAVGLDPDAEMLAVAAETAAERDVTNVTWVQEVAEHLDLVGGPPWRLVSFGQSYHWTQREAVAELVFDRLEPGGAIVLLAHTVDGRPEPPNPGHPPIPHEQVEELVAQYLGPRRRAGQGFATPPSTRYEESLARTRFGPARIVFAPGRADLVRDVDGVVAGYYSLSWCAPHLFGDRRGRFEAELRELLAAQSVDGRFWDWPGDTEMVIGTKAS